MTAATELGGWGYFWRESGPFSGKSPLPPDFGGPGSLASCPEILHPIQPIIKSNKKAFRKDNKEWNSVKKSALLWRHEAVTLRYRILDTKIAVMTAYFKSTKGTLTQLITLGMQPFLRSATTNTVFTLDYTSPRLEQAKIYSIDVTYLNIERTATT